MPAEPPLNPSIYRQGALATLLATTFTMGGGFLALFLANRLLGKDLFATYAVGTTIVFFAGVLFSAGLERVLIYQVSKQDSTDIAGRVLCAALCAGGLGMGVVYIFADALGAIIQLPQSDVALRSLSPMVLILPLLWVASEWRRAQGQFYLAYSIPAGSEVIRAAGLGALILAGAGLTGAGVVTSLSLLVPLCVLVYAHPRIPNLRPGRIVAADMVYGLRSMATRLVREATTRLNLIVLGILSTPQMTADYAVAARLAMALLVAQTMLAAPFGPRVTTLVTRGDMQQLDREFQQTRDISTVLALFGALVLVVFGQWGLALFGDYAAAYPLLLILSAAFVSDVMAGPGVLILSMAGHARAGLYVRMAGLGVLTVAACALIPAFGGMGAGAALGLSALTTHVMSHVLIKRAIGLTLLQPDVCLRIALSIGALVFAALGGPVLLSAALLFGVLMFGLWRVCRGRA